MLGTTSLGEIRRYLREKCNCSEDELRARMQTHVVDLDSGNEAREVRLRQLLVELEESVREKRETQS